MRVGLILTLAVMVVFGTPAWAQKKSAKASKPGKAAADVAGAAAAATEGGNKDPAASNVKVERGAGGKKIYRITSEIRIEGKIQKPEAFYVLQKSGINYDWQELKQEFLPKIVDSVSRSPF